mmetsp:Transcript_30749/g.60441  ORF Transcript_30749/g.60441 Transcript_30749/m.60441 type:complete len:243 (-) Transcript_30749:348-1076(-)
MAMAWISSATGPMTTHFWGPIANWGMSLSAIYDANALMPEMINERMTATQMAYSSLFMGFAWKVQPRNYILFGCHSANVLAQGNQLRRWGEHNLAQGETGKASVTMMGAIIGGTLAGSGCLVAASGQMKKVCAASMPGFISRLALHKAGPFTIFFWAPNFKYALSINNILDYQKPVEKISTSLTSAMALTGCLFMRWSFVITPVNYSLFLVNALLATTSAYHLGRKYQAYGSSAFMPSSSSK